MTSRLVTALRAVLPRSRRGRALALGAGVDTFATGLYLAAATLYFVVFVGIPAVEVGGALAIANVCGLLSPLPFGRLADRIGARRVYIPLVFVRAAGYASYVLADSYLSYLVITCLLTAANRACTPLLQVIVAEFEGERSRTQTMASLRTVNNIGLTVGFLVAAAVQSLHSRFAFGALFVVSGVAFVVVGLITIRAARMPAEDETTVVSDEPGTTPAAVGATAVTAATPAPPAGTPATPTPVPPAVERVSSPYRDTRFIAFTIANAALLLHDSILFILIPLWIVKHAGLSASVSSALLALNTVVTVLLQVYVSRFARGVAGSLRLLRYACVALVVGCLLFAGTDGRGAGVVVALGALAVLALTVGENVHAVAAWELSYELSAAATRTQYIAMFSLSQTLQTIVGPVLMTAVVLRHGGVGWSLLAAIFVVATAVSWLAVRLFADRGRLARRRIVDSAELS
jgi:hypothetical protein